MSALLALLCAAAASCPSRQAVEERMARLGGAGRSWELTFTRRGEVVLLEASSGALTVARELPATGSCEALEEAAAVILVSHAPDVAQTESVRRRVVSPVTSTPSAAEASAPGLEWGVGLGPSLVVGETGPGWGGLAYGWLRSPSSPVAVGVAISGAGPRTIAFGAGGLAWGRLSVGAGVEFPLSSGALAVTPWAQLVTGVFWASASGLIGARSVASGDLGVRLGARVELPLSGALQLFAGLSGTAWALRHRATLEASVEAVTLPWLELEASVGVSWHG